MPRTFKFATEDTLGKLNKWLRILGFDSCETSGCIAGPGPAPDSDRLYLTRTRKQFERLPRHRRLFIHSNDPVDQVREVIQTLGIAETDITPFSRCIRCNTPIDPIAKEFVRNDVPDYVWTTSDRFHQCRRCRKIYWAGSHTECGLEKIRFLFRKRKARSSPHGSAS